MYCRCYLLPTPLYIVRKRNEWYLTFGILPTSQPHSIRTLCPLQIIPFGVFMRETDQRCSLTPEWNGRVLSPRLRDRESIATTPYQRAFQWRFQDFNLRNGGIICSFPSSPFCPFSPLLPTSLIQPHRTSLQLIQWSRNFRPGFARTALEELTDSKYTFWD